MDQMVKKRVLKRINVKTLDMHYLHTMILNRYIVMMMTV